MDGQQGRYRAVGLSPGQMYQWIDNEIYRDNTGSTLFGHARQFSLSAKHDTGCQISYPVPFDSSQWDEANIGFNLEPGLGRTGPPRLSGRKIRRQRQCVAWPCQTQRPAHHFPLDYRSHGTANTTENISQLIVSYWIALFNCILSF